MNKDDLDEIIEQKIREKQEELIDKRVEEKLQEHRSKAEDSSTKADEDNGSISRRRFLKLAGLGAGGLALSSTTGAWYKVGGGNSGDNDSEQPTLSQVLTSGNDINGNDIVDSGTTVWDTSNSEVPGSQLGNHGNNQHSTNYSPQSHDHSGETISPNSVSGNITSRSGGITQIDSNVYKGSSQPSNPVQGDQWIDTDNNEYKIYNESGWRFINDISALPDPDAYLLDSWDDGWLKRPRTDQANGSYTQADGTTLNNARYRPDWDIVDNNDNNSPTVNNSYIVIDGDGSNFTDGDYLVTESEFFVGKWKFDMRIPNYYTGSGSHLYKIQLLSDNKYAERDSGDWWCFGVGTDNTGTHLIKCDSGTQTEVISGGNPLNDESWHTIEITRDQDGNWDVLVDDSSLGTATDSFLPSVNWFGFGVRNNDNRGSGNEYHIDNLRLGSV